MPKLIKGKTCAITFEQRHAEEPPRTIIGTWTGEIDTWGKHTIALLDTAAEGPYYLFANEVLAVVPLSPQELDAEREGIRVGRLEKARGLLRTADQLIQAAEIETSWARASAAARISLLVQKAITAIGETV